MSRTVHYVLSTHWDREWYQTFQNFRYRLVQLLDRVIEAWESGSLQGPLQTDGQFILIEDYLEVRPERRSLVERLVREGRLVVGPWYVLPDEFLVSGESLVRNLRLGRESARCMGAEPSRAGFLCDMFGHNSQMPQIFAGFGIRGGFVWRGTNLTQGQFIWRGADGTELPCYRFGKEGYCTYAVQVRGANLHGALLEAGELRQRLDGFLDSESARTQAGPLLAFDGGDHMAWDPAAYAVLAERLGKESGGYHWMHSTLDAYLEEMLPGTSEICVRMDGELREPGRYPAEVDNQWLIPGVTSSRVNLKQANAACQDMLCQWAEPFSAFATTVLGTEYPQGYLDVAWRWLLQNHPHDSICGCSIDSVHEDMMYRFHQCGQIAERLTLEATQHITAGVEGVVGEKEVRVCVFNPLPVDLDEIVDLDLELPTGWPTFQGMSDRQARYAFRLYDPAGEELPYQRLAQAGGQKRMRLFAAGFPHSYPVNVTRVSLPLRIPAMGYQTLIVRAGEAGVVTRHPVTPGLVVSDRGMENQYIQVVVQVDGTLILTDKRSGETYTRLLTFEDRADIGDGWNYGPAVSDTVFYSSGCPVSLSLVHQGRYRAAVRIRTVMDVPKDFDFTTMTRSESLVGLIIDSTVTLREGARRVEVETVVHNNARDHRLRVMFPTHTQAQTYLADTPFDVVERKIALRDDNHTYREPEIETKPQQSLCAVGDRQRGLAVISSGLLESAVIDLPERPLALTLFRATRQTVGTQGEPGGQMPGEMRFRYWIAPFSGEPDRASLIRMGQLLSGGIRAVPFYAEDAPLHHSQRTLPPSAGFLRVEGAVILTSLRRTPAGLEARVFNPNPHRVEMTLDLSGWPAGIQLPRSAWTVDFESHPVGDPRAVSDGRASFSLGPKQILTVCFA